MPDIGFFELLLIGVVLFLVVGPERMPEAFAQIADLLRGLRSWAQEAQRAMREQMRELEEPAQQPVQRAREELKRLESELRGDIEGQAGPERDPTERGDGNAR